MRQRKPNCAAGRNGGVFIAIDPDRVSKVRIPRGQIDDRRATEVTDLVVGEIEDPLDRSLLVPLKADRGMVLADAARGVGVGEVSRSELENLAGVGGGGIDRVSAAGAVAQRD